MLTEGKVEITRKTEEILDRRGARVDGDGLGGVQQSGGRQSSMAKHDCRIHRCPSRGGGRQVTYDMRTIDHSTRTQ